MGKIYFATTNTEKLKEAREILKMDVEGIPLEIDEIQSMDPVEVAVKKAREYYKSLKKPIFVEDVSVFIKAFNGLPGPFIDTFMKTLGNDGIVKLMKGRKDRSLAAQATVVYMDSLGKEHVFIGKVNGTIPEKPKGKGFGWNPIFIPKGDTKTFAEMTLEEKFKFSMRAKALNKLKDFLDKNV